MLDGRAAMPTSSRSDIRGRNPLQPGRLSHDFGQSRRHRDFRHTRSTERERRSRDLTGTLARNAVVGEDGEALSGAGIFAVVKRLFARAAETAAAAGLDPARLQRASTHWMRHTFVRQALVDGAPIEVVGELAGHASIAATSTNRAPATGAQSSCGTDDEATYGSTRASHGH